MCRLVFSTYLARRADGIRISLLYRCNDGTRRVPATLYPATQYPATLYTALTIMIFTKRRHGVYRSLTLLPGDWTLEYQRSIT